MLAHFSKILRNHPVVAIEHMMYIQLLVAGFWGLIPSNSSLTIERLVNQFGVHAVVAQYTIYILVGMYGHLSISTVRIEQRIQTSRLAFLAYAYATVANLGIYFFGGHFNPISLMLNISWGLAAGIIFLHLNIRHREGVEGRDRY